MFFRVDNPRPDQEPRPPRPEFILLVIAILDFGTAVLDNSDTIGSLIHQVAEIIS